LGLQSNFRPALQSAARLALPKCIVHTYRLIPSVTSFDYYFSAPTAPWILSRGVEHLVLTSLIAHTHTHTQWRCTAFGSFHSALGVLSGGKGTAGCRHAPGDPVVRLRCRLAPNLLTSCNLLMYGAPCAAS
jgi:hypothetical protein